MTALTTLFILASGLGLATLMARYNEDDSLFWKFAICLIGGFAAGAVAKTMLQSSDEQSKVVMIEKAPTQVLQGTSCNFYTLADISLAATKREKSPKPVSKDSLISQNNSTLSEVHVSARGQPHFCMYYDDS